MYQNLQVIGEGGFGRTYKGEHLNLPGVYACLKQNININDEDAVFLQKEATLLSQINHYSLPSFRDFFQAPDKSYMLVMQFIEGKNLYSAVEKHKAIEPESIAWITQRLLNALHYCHAEGIIHGDIKPPNIIVQPFKHNAFLVDFGLSSVRPTAKTKPKGYTEVFVAPETLTGKPPIPESDLYSLGLTMIYALGGNPFTKTMPSHVPQPLQEFFKRLVQHEPLKRDSWEKGDLIARLSDTRLESFGRRHST